MSMSHIPSGGGRRFAPLVLLAGVAAAVVMALSMTNTLSAFVATITNSNDTAAAGTVVLQETNATGSVTCNSIDNTTISTDSATCATINKYGGSTTMVPSNTAGGPGTAGVTTLVNFRNTGTAPASSFQIAFQPCVQGTNGTLNGSATDYCSKLRVNVTSGSTVIVPNQTAAELAGKSFPITGAAIPAANGASTVPMTFTVYLDSTAGNTYQGLSASQPIVWTLAS